MSFTPQLCNALCLLQQRLHHVILVKKILTAAVVTMDSASLKITEGAKMNLHYLVRHPCPRKYIAALGMIKIVERLSNHPNVHVSKLATQLLKQPEWLEEPGNDQSVGASRTRKATKGVGNNVEACKSQSLRRKSWENLVIKTRN